MDLHTSVVNIAFNGDAKIGNAIAGFLDVYAFIFFGEDTSTNWSWFNDFAIGTAAFFTAPKNTLL